ncbi:hypothetical protein EDD11_010091, partial [Mortierella claussenii]
MLNNYRHKSETWFRQAWEAISYLPNVQSLALYRVHFDGVLSSIDKLCIRVKTLKTHNCTIDSLEAKETDIPWTIQDLTISTDCKIDMVAIITKCPSLRVLYIGGRGDSNDWVLEKAYELKRFQDLAAHFDFGALPLLKRLEVDLFFCSDEDITTFIQGMRCLRGFKTGGQIGPLSLPGLRSHFPMITKIDLWSSVPTWIWMEIMTSCPCLTFVKEVTFSSNDILHGEPWICKALSYLHLTIEDDDEHSLPEIRAVEHAMFLRVSRLEKLTSLDIDESLSVKPLSNQSDKKALKKERKKNKRRTLDTAGVELLTNLTQLRRLTFGFGMSPVLNTRTAEMIA